MLLQAVIIIVVSLERQTSGTKFDLKPMKISSVTSKI